MISGHPIRIDLKHTFFDFSAFFITYETSWAIFVQIIEQNNGSLYKFPNS